MRTRAALLILAALAGAGVLAVLGPRSDTTLTVWRPGLTAAGAVARARVLAAASGLDIRSWRCRVEVVTHERLRDAREMFPADPLLASFPLLEYRVAAASPSGGETAVVTFSSESRPSSFLWRRPARGYRGSEPQGEEIAGRELARYTGPAARLYRPIAAGVRTQEGSRWAWEFPAAAAQGMVAQFAAVVRDGRLVRADYELQVGSQVTRTAAERSRGATLPFLVIIMVAALAAFFYALWIVFARATRRRDHLQFSLRLLPFPAAVLLADMASGNALNPLLFSSLADEARGPGWVLPAFALGFLILAGGALATAAGYVQLAPSQRHSWLSLRMAASGWLFRRRIGREMTLGLLAGVACAALPYALAALPALATGPVALLGPGRIALPRPELAPLRDLYPFHALILFAILMPLAGRFTGSPWLRAALAAPVGIPFLAFAWSPFESAPGLTLLVAAGFWAVLCLLYETEGLLAVWMVPAGIAASAQCLALLAAPAPALAVLGLRTALIWSAFAAATAALWALGRPADEAALAASMEPGEHGLSRSEREHLRALLSVASRAQQRMLPAAPPSIPGFRLAAVCQPAREVGGDLYDFLELPEGRWILCVGDVSGKGLPAALYMTLTSGMLAAARLRDDPVAEIALRLNRLLAASGRRRTFVTMALAALDPATATLTLVRAGHNPPLHVRPSGPAEFLQPSGLGLGITAGPVFENHLATATVRLEAGDTLVLYSDGLTECMNPAKELYGEERLKVLVEENRRLDPESLRDAILESTRRFRGAAEAHDDLTVVILQTTAPYDNPN